MACCLNITLQFNGDPGLTEFTLGTPSGQYNGADYWNFQISGQWYQIRLDIDINGHCRWELWAIENDVPPPISGTLFAVFPDDQYRKETCSVCPFGPWVPTNKEVILFRVAECGACAPVQERFQQFFNSIKLPEVFEEPDRGFFKCCTPFLVLAKPGGETWENDISSAWFKASDPSDIITFSLTKNGQPTTYTPTPQDFPNEPNAKYATVEWVDVLQSDGAGCYTLTIDYNIQGLTGSIIWGVYFLKPFTIENALRTARLRVFFNLNQEIEGINFTGANVQDTFRFYGFIGRRQPNTEIDNLIYSDRTVRSVVRENLNTYEIETDPLNEDFIKRLTDLYLLSENELFISDYNAHNHSYRYNDLPAIVEEAPEIDYLDPYQRKARLTCKVGDKKKNKRTFY